VRVRWTEEGIQLYDTEKIVHLNSLEAYRFVLLHERNNVYLSTSLLRGRLTQGTLSTDATIVKDQQCILSSCSLYYLHTKVHLLGNFLSWCYYGTK
jgi:hypothetical protein